mmetsp:Transcript_56066/g.65489  ORF Transcript_56066/g.65489 Transcript_56066/m.65489 type:complete len:100 (-) Transcript_56066:45-344(-)
MHFSKSSDDLEQVKTRHLKVEASSVTIACPIPFVPPVTIALDPLGKFHLDGSGDDSDFTRHVIYAIITKCKAKQCLKHGIYGRLKSFIMILVVPSEVKS